MTETTKIHQNNQSVPNLQKITKGGWGWGGGGNIKLDADVSDRKRFFRSLSFSGKSSSPSTSSSNPERSKSSLLALIIESPSSSWLLCWAAWFSRHGVPRIKITLELGILNSEWEKEQLFSWEFSNLIWDVLGYSILTQHTSNKSEFAMADYELIKEVFFRMECFV